MFSKSLIQFSVDGWSSVPSLLFTWAQTMVGASLVAQIKASACNEGDLGSIPGSGGSPGEGKGYPLQYSGLENSMDYTVHRVTKSGTRLSDFHFTVQKNSGTLRGNSGSWFGTGNWTKRE